MSTCEKDWIDILSSLLTPTLAVGALGIATFQLWLANTRMKYDLFERRYAVYSAINSFIGDTLAAGNSTHEMQRDYLYRTNSAQFLFGPTYAEFVKKVLDESIDLEASCSISKTNNDEDLRVKHLSNSAEIKKSLLRRLHELNELSEPYLNLREIFFWQRKNRTNKDRLWCDWHDSQLAGESPAFAL